ncbi:excalibur calcium-binding domain-containing protein [Actinokineospora sp. NBRC 105648]|uniref:thermonuclease family protein n=1 Tax=Actinokineospora sp. NBRC 105648 TaxID=3032206 RepID=UPI0024A3CECF|nr:excalibur calcium-binding domain-containing protein [Actinokineospora sp. NBRC 105648]GLZ40319.1 hypothetical protein Acsp05_39430 [Actinokineospora sp. NBRC 105648]
MATRRTTVAGTSLLCLALLGGCAATDRTAAEPVGSAPPAVSTTTAEPTTTTTTPTPTAPAKATVSEVVDARTVLTSAGKKVVVAGLAAPGECWQAAAQEYARGILAGQQVYLSDVGNLTLADGTDFALSAISKGMAKTTAVASLTLTDAQQVAQTAALGLWGAPCSGSDSTPVTTKRAVQPLVPVVPPPPAPAPVEEPVAAPTEQGGAYYKSCAEAKKAGAAPMHRGEPGYRAALDRDKDGIACDT